MCFHAEPWAHFMKKFSLIFVAATLLTGAALAQGPAKAPVPATTPMTAPAVAPTAPVAPAPAITASVVPPAAAAPAGKTGVASKAASVKAVCKDGTKFEGNTLQGACSGHGGVDSKDSKTASKSTRGRAGQVWVNVDSKIYHCKGDQFFGKTKTGQYMTKEEANAKGFQASKSSKNCTS